jgi:hypothetical protein
MAASCDGNILSPEGGLPLAVVIFRIFRGVTGGHVGHDVDTVAVDTVFSI